MAEQEGPDHFRLTIITPERTVFDGPVTVLTVSAPQGVLQIFPRHEALLSPLAVHNIAFMQPNQPKETQAAVLGGFLEVAGAGVTVLADVAELGADVDAQRAQEAKDRAEARLRGQKAGEKVDVDRAQAALLRSIARIRAAEAKPI